MAKLRFQAVHDSLNRPLPSNSSSEKQSDMFAKNVFNEDTMRRYMSEEAFLGVVNASSKGEKIDRSIANQVASAMKNWAIERGVTHYTHWFQPLTGATAEKHDSFFDFSKDGKVMEKFDADALVQQEPDASSFPHGGLRNTFEARGYTAWDPTSPAFIYGETLCIPTIFVSYTGDALDYKTPLLRALQAVDKHATEVAKYFDKNVRKVTASLGWEQEYFLIDSALAESRPDLSLTGRTLFGHSAAKGQQLDDHYFGSIPARALAFMKDLEYECYILGIPVKTRHNEVAPNQFELAPIYEETNLAVDHNALLMDLMGKIAAKHKFKVLFHEKPFKDINGSGKHNNWSLQTDTGINLLSPGKTPMRNLQFLTFFINTIKAVHDYEDLMRSGVASASNDERLGANEAPPAVMSVFIGSQLSKVLADLESVTTGKLSPKEKTDLKLNVVGKIPEILVDNTDRNRTSPFAFTGNKFEYRAVGSKANCAEPMTILNTIVAQQLKDFKVEVDKLVDKKGLKKDEAIFNVLREYIKMAKGIIFDGNGYGEEWLKEAAKRGLSNNRTTPEALKAKISDKSQKLFDQMKVLNPGELNARYEIQLELYVKSVQIEGRVIGDLATNHVIPTAIQYQNILLKNIMGIKEVFDEDFMKFAEEPKTMVKGIAEHILNIQQDVEAMRRARKRANAMEDAFDKAMAYCHDVKPYFEQIRYHCDKLELMIDDEIWPLTKYRELLFTR